MTHVTCRLTTKNRDQLRNPTFGNRVLATFTFLLLIIYVILEKNNPLAHPTWKCTTLTCEVPNFFYLTEGLHCTCIFRTCVFHPCEMRCFVLAFSVHAFSSTCVFSAPISVTVWSILAESWWYMLVPSAYSKVQILNFRQCYMADSRYLENRKLLKYIL